MLAVALLLGGLWLLAFGLLHGWFPGAQRWMILEALDRGMGIDAELAAAGGSLVDGIELEGLIIKPGRSDGTAATRDADDIPLIADRVKVKVDLARAFEERVIVVNQLLLDGIAIRLQQDEAGEWQVLGLSAPVEDDAPASADVVTPEWRFEFDDVEIRNANLSARWYDLQGPGYLIANGVLSTRDLSWPNESDSILPSVLAADFRLSEGEFGPLQFNAGRLRVTGRQNHLDLRLDRTTARGPEQGRFHLGAHASVDLDGARATLAALDAELAFSKLDLESLGAAASNPIDLPATELNGNVQIHLFDAAHQVLEFWLTLDPSEFEHRAFDSATAELRYAVATQEWVFDDLFVSSQQSSLAGSGSGIRDAIDVMNINASNLPIGGIAEALDIETPLEGRANISARLTGVADDPVGEVVLNGSVAIDGRAPLDVGLEVWARGERRYEIAQLELSTDEPSNLHFESVGTSEITGSNEGWTLSNLDLDGRSGDVEISSATLNGNATMLEGVVESLDLAAIASYVDPTLEIGGLLTGPVAIERHGNRVRLDTDATWREPRYETLSATEIELRATTDDDLILLAGAIDWGASSSVELTATIPNDTLATSANEIPSREGFRFEISLENLPATDLSAFLPAEQDTSQILAGTLTGSLRAIGTRAGPELDCSAAWTDARFGTATADDVHLSCRTEARTLLLNIGISDQAQNGFVANASIEIDPLIDDPRNVLHNPNNRADLRARDVDLTWLIPRASARRLGRIKRVTGLATGELVVTGSPEGPLVNGGLTVDGAKLHLALVDEKIGPIAGRLVFSNDEVRAERIEIGSSRGQAVVQGRYRFGSPGDDDLDARARFDNFALTHFPLLDARVDGDLKFNGSLSRIDTEGDLVFSRVEVSLPAPEDPLLREVRILGLEGDDAEAQDPLGRAGPSAYQTMRANIDIDVRPGARIKERGVDVVAEGQFRLRKKRLSPTLLQGNLQTTGGTYTFLGRTFDVTHGTATFEERIPPDPELELSASRRVGDVTVGIELTGRWSDRHSRLTSVPEMDENEILSYLVFDKPISEIGDRDDQQLNAVAAQLAGNLALSQITKAITDQLPINEISVDVGEDLTVSSVGVETNVGDDITLRYDRSLQTGVGDRLTVEWKFYKDFSLRSEYANGDTSGLDLFWSYEY